MLLRSPLRPLFSRSFCFTTQTPQRDFVLKLDKFTRQKNMNEAFSFLQSIEEMGFSHNVHTFNSMMRFYITAADMHSVINTLHRAEEVGADNQTYNIALNAASRFGSKSDVHQILLKMKKAGLQPDLYTYTCLIRAVG
jgi:pentatricopeptide repeat protein